MNIITLPEAQEKPLTYCKELEINIKLNTKRRNRMTLHKLL